MRTSPPRLTAISLSTLVALAVMPPGCAAPTRELAVRVDALAPGTPAGQPRPQPGATVWVMPSTAAHPLDFAALFRGRPDVPGGVTTDAQGLARFRIPPDSPFVVTVWLPGEGPASRTFDGLADAQRTGPWPLRQLFSAPSALAPDWRAAVLTEPATAGP